MTTWTCPTCHHTIPAGQSPCHCAGCHETFIGLTAFDHHRSAFTCHDPATITTKPGEPGFSRDHDGNWHWAEIRTPDQWAQAAADRAAQGRRIARNLHTNAS